MEKEVAKMSEAHADIVIGKKFPAAVDSPLFYEKMLDNFFSGLENANHSPSKQHQRKIEHVIGNLIESLDEALQRLNSDIESSVSLIKRGIADITNDNN